MGCPSKNDSDDGIQHAPLCFTPSHQHCTTPRQKEAVAAPAMPRMAHAQHSPSTLIRDPRPQALTVQSLLVASDHRTAGTQTLQHGSGTCTWWCECKTGTGETGCANPKLHQKEMGKEGERTTASLRAGHWWRLPQAVNELGCVGSLGGLGDFRGNLAVNVKTHETQQASTTSSNVSWSPAPPPSTHRP